MKLKSLNRKQGYFTNNCKKVNNVFVCVFLSFSDLYNQETGVLQDAIYHFICYFVYIQNKQNHPVVASWHEKFTVCCWFLRAHLYLIGECSNIMVMYVLVCVSRKSARCSVAALLIALLGVNSSGCHVTLTYYRSDPQTKISFCSLLSVDLKEISK